MFNSGALNSHAPLADAASAICSLLSEFGLDANRHDQLVEWLVSDACDNRSVPPERLTAVVVRHVEERLEAWLGEVLGPEILAGQPALPIGRAAFLACDGPTAWANCFLVHDDLPQSFLTAMRAAAPSTSPMPMPGTMPEQPLDSWSIADARSAVLHVLEGPLGRAVSARPLRIASMTLTKPS